jgi:sugar phosphate isomerase/epimerase
MRLTCYGINHKRKDWEHVLSGVSFDLFFAELAQELERFGIVLERANDAGQVIEVTSYADLLNAIRIASPADGISNVCVGHVIGKSPHLDPLEDIRRAVNRIAFAPETVPPDDENRKVCHNCGCGC